MNRLIVGALAVVLAACSSKSKGVAPASTSNASVRAQMAIDGLARFPSLAKLGKGAALARAGEGFVLDERGPKAIVAGGGVFSARVPLRANGAVHVAAGDRAGVFVDVSSELADVAGEAVESTVVYAGVGAETDLFQIVEPHRVEELRVLHGPRAAKSFTWTLHPGPAVTEVRLRDGRVEVLEGAAVRIVSEPIVAIDARDTKRAASVTLTKLDTGYRLDARLDAEGLAYPIALDPGWTVTFGHMSYFHYLFTAVSLTDGRVVAFPGASPPKLEADIYDPITDKFTLGKPVNYGRYHAAAVRLGSTDKVLIVGGDYGPYDAQYEIWSPATGSSAAKALPFAMHNPALAVLPSGKVFAFATGSKAAIYNPVTDAWTLTADDPAAHGGASVVTLASGKVLVSGGCCSQGWAEVYDPTTDTWASTPSMNGARSGHKMFKLPSGKILLIGNDTGTGRAEIYDEIANTWTKELTIPVDPWAFGAAQFPDGRVLVANASSTYKQTLIYEEGKGWSTGTNLNARRDGVVVVPLSDGRAIGLGGEGGTVGLEDTRYNAELWSPTAKTCTTSGDCTSGACVDGYCCDRGCTEQCNACDIAGREGYCMPLTGAPPHGTRTSCAPYLNCYSGACLGACTGVADCTAGNACIFGTCAVKLTKGTACFDGTDCATGNCVDGVCCDTTCTGQCKACDVSGSVGTCVDVTDAPHGTRTSCTPYVCGGGACRTACTADAQCSAGNYCDATNKCVPAQTNGKACSAGTQCTSGFCVDGFCCNSACGNACQTCSKTPGTCQNVTSGTPDPRSICVGECATGCGATGCVYAASTVTCGVSCIGNTLTNGGRCSGTSEACTGSVSAPCPGGLKCETGKTCKTSCTVDADCVSNKCDTTTGTCGAAPVDAGPPDTGLADSFVPDAAPDTDVDVADTFVPDTFVPDTLVPETAEMDAREIAETPAPQIDPKSALPVSVSTCAKDADCTSGFCVEGVCCDSRCDSPCHSCALLSAPGKCTEEPTGVDLKQDCGPAFTCLGTCGPGGECIGAGKGTMCARNRCTGPSAGVGPAFCQAPGGKCDGNEAVPFDCSPYACAPAFGACLTGCSSSLDCADGFLCDTGSRTCVAVQPPSDGGGCAFGPSARTRGLPGLAIALALLGLVGKRRANRQW